MSDWCHDTHQKFENDVIAFVDLLVEAICLPGLELPHHRRLYAYGMHRPEQQQQAERGVSEHRTRRKRRKRGADTPLLFVRYIAR